jgi:hypothetical protein
MVDGIKKTIDVVTLALYRDLLPAYTSIGQAYCMLSLVERGRGFPGPPHSVIAVGLCYRIISSDAMFPLENKSLWPIRSGNNKR